MPAHQEGHKEVGDLVITRVPNCYWDLKEVFNKTRELILSHRPNDCSIDLFPGAPIREGRFYSLSATEQKTTEDHNTASLKRGIIKPPSSPSSQQG